MAWLGNYGPSLERGGMTHGSQAVKQSLRSADTNGHKTAASASRSTA